MKRLLVALSLSLFSLVIFAQADFKPGYIINLEGDTLHGFIDYRGDIYNATMCLYKESENAKRISYNPRQIRAYRIRDGKYYVSRKVEIEGDLRTVFLEFLVDGRADLYYFPETHYFIETDDQELRELENTEEIVSEKNKDYFREKKEYVGVLNVYMKDCPEIRKEIPDVELNQRSLIKITSQYHNMVCPDENCTVYVKKKFGAQFRLTLNFGTALSKIHMYSYDAYGYAVKLGSSFAIGPAAHLELDVFSPGSFERFFSTFGVGYSHCLHEGEESYPMHLVSRNLSISYHFNYIYPRFKFKPFAGVGITYSSTFKNEESIRSSYNVRHQPGKRTLGPSAKLGFIYDLSSRLSLKFTTDYFLGLWNHFYDPYVATPSSNRNMLLGIQYKFGK